VPSWLTCEKIFGLEGFFTTSGFETVELLFFTPGLGVPAILLPVISKLSIRRDRECNSSLIQHIAHFKVLKTCKLGTIIILSAFTLIISFGIHATHTPHKLRHVSKTIDEIALLLISGAKIGLRNLTLSDSQGALLGDFLLAHVSLRGVTLWEGLLQFIVGIRNRWGCRERPMPKLRI